MIPASLRQKLDAQRGEELVVLTLEEFFDGNRDVASIGCNLAEPPSLADFRRVLTSIRARADVQDVLMCVSEDMGDEDWPFVDRVLVLTTAPVTDVAAWLAPLQADEPYLLETYPGPTRFLPALRERHTVVAGWWD